MISFVRGDQYALDPKRDSMINGVIEADAAFSG